jgi:hypothetical protein
MRRIRDLVDEAASTGSSVDDVVNVLRVVCPETSGSSQSGA